MGKRCARENDWTRSMQRFGLEEKDQKIMPPNPFEQPWLLSICE
mgnify:CR=1 FL=1